MLKVSIGFLCFLSLGVLATVFSCAWAASGLLLPLPLVTFTFSEAPLAENNVGLPEDGPQPTLPFTAPFTALAVERPFLLGVRDW